MKKKKKYEAPKDEGGPYSWALTDCTKENEEGEKTEYLVVKVVTHNKPFKEYIKELGGKWNLPQRGYLFTTDQVEEHDGLVDKIGEKFDEWSFADERPEVESADNQSNSGDDEASSDEDN